MATTEVVGLQGSTASDLCDYMRRGMVNIGCVMPEVPPRWESEMQLLLDERGADAIRSVIVFTFGQTCASRWWPTVITPMRLRKHFDALQGERARWRASHLPPEQTAAQLTSTGSRVQAMNRLVEQGMSRDEAKRRVGWRAD